MDKNNLALHASIEKLMDEYALSVVKERLDPIRKEFKAVGAIVEHLNVVQEHIVENFNVFIPANKTSTCLSRPIKPNSSRRARRPVMLKRLFSNIKST
jgi:hypothetical protein